MKCPRCNTEKILLLCSYTCECDRPERAKRQTTPGIGGPLPEASEDQAWVVFTHRPSIGTAVWLTPGEYMYSTADGAMQHVGGFGFPVLVSGIDGKACNWKVPKPGLAGVVKRVGP